MTDPIPRPFPPAAEEPTGGAIGQAFALGWQVAQLYHAPVPATGAPVPSSVPSTLPGLGSLTAAERFQTELDTIQEGIGILCHPARRPPATAAVTVALEATPVSADSLRLAVYTLHVGLLRALTVTDYRLGKAYSLGRALAETVFVPAAADDQDYLTGLTGMLNAGRVREMTGWLEALKSRLPSHAAYATSRTLAIWATSGDEREAAVSATRDALAAQGRVWRALLSGEKNPADLLCEGDYLLAAEALGRRFRGLAGDFLKHYKWALATLGALVVAVLVWAGVSSKLTGGAKLAADIAAIAAFLGITGKSASAAISKVASHLETPLWQSELDESIAIAAIRLPQGARIPERRDGDAVGELRAGPAEPDHDRDHRPAGPEASGN